MKILRPVNTTEITYKADYSEILAKLTTLSPGLALPVECDDQRAAMKLQLWVFQILNRKNVYGSKWSAVRRKNTVFISRAEHIPNEKRTA
jgi:hypothetical protein